MRSLRFFGLAALAASLLLVSLPHVTFAQSRRADRWLTLDSAVAVVGVTATQRNAFAEHYAAINQALRRAADLHAAWRAHAGQQVTAQQRDDFLQQINTLHNTVETEFAALRGLLSVEQQARLDRLDRPKLNAIGRRGS